MSAIEMFQQLAPPTSMVDYCSARLKQVGDGCGIETASRVDTFVTCPPKVILFKLAAGGTPVNRLTRYWKYAVFGTVVPGVALFIAAAPKLVWKDNPDPFWKLLFSLAGILCSVGLLMWLCMAIVSVGSDVTKLWKKSKLGALLTFTATGLLARVRQSFTGPNFYGWYADAWFFFFMALLLGSYLLLRISVALTGARKN